MSPLLTGRTRAPLATVLAGLIAGVFPCPAQPAAPGDTNEIRIVEIQGTVEVSPAGAATWVLTQAQQALHPYDRVRTGARSRAALRWTDQSVIPLAPLTEVQILPRQAERDSPGLHLFRGILSFFHRGEPGRLRLLTRGGSASVEGTEFVLSVDPDPRAELTTLSLIDGRVQFSNELASLILTNGQQAVAGPGIAPRRTAGFIANNLLQWCFYYPAVLDLDEIPLAPEEQALLRESLEAYRAGDVNLALARYPAGREPRSAAERVYYAALLLSVGEAAPATATLALLPPDAERPRRLARALQELVAAVKREPSPASTPPQLASELLAASYLEQSRAVRDVSLRSALRLARQAAANAPGFAFARARVAELEFSFGELPAAESALDQSLALAPRNAQALALKGFLLAARGRIRPAGEWFDRALAADAALGNAWLGRGLCRIRLGALADGRQDLLVAAALEPQRAALRSYLAKAYAEEGNRRRAGAELELAKRLDPDDPTAWLYSALLDQEYGRINEAARDLEQSQALNQNRRVYRSGLRLDEDQAVRSANLAAIYRDAGMPEVSLREASRAVSEDYANYSAHLFLAQSYDAFRDPNRVNLRYETPAQSEYLLANLLAPVGAGALSSTISQQEYSRLFERDRLGLVSTAEYLSRGAWTESAAQFGTVGRSSWSAEAFYRTDPGQRVNDDFEEREFSLQMKEQLSPADTFLLHISLYNAEGGDVAERYDPATANPGLRTDERQEPMLLAGYHRAWSPQSHTLLLVGRLSDQLQVRDPAQAVLYTDKTAAGSLDGVIPITLREQYQSTLEIYSVEAQQIWKQSAHNTIVGARAQAGSFQTQTVQTDPPLIYAAFFGSPAARQGLRSDFERESLYAYHDWQIVDSLRLSGGLAYDHLRYPADFRAAPISPREEQRERWSPKAGFIWEASPGTVLRAAYTRSLGGAGLDQSFQLEPAQVAGFLQSFRSLLPESVGGAEAGATFETFGAALEQKFRTGAYLALSGEILQSRIERTLGTFEFNPLGSALPATTRENLHYREKSLRLTFDQLLGDEFSLGARYQLSDATLTDDFPQVADGADLHGGFLKHQNLESVLHQVTLTAGYNHPGGVFTRFDAVWYGQSNLGYTPDRPGDDFWQLNLSAGYRFPRRRAEIRVGLLNLTGQDYRLNPLNLYNELPRTRTLAVRCQFSF